MANELQEMTNKPNNTILIYKINIKVSKVTERSSGGGWSHLICVVHPHATSPPREVKHLPLLGFAPVGGGKDYLEFAGLVYHKVRRSVLLDRDTTCVME